jgi:uncharacterized membrane protein YhaH (DUF805 family)
MGWAGYLFSWRGRINRSKMWLFYLLGSMVMPLALGLIYATAILAGIPDPFIHSPRAWFEWFAYAAMICCIGVYIFGFFAVVAKRLHDRNHSAWWQVFVYAVLVEAPNLANHLAKLHVSHASQIGGDAKSAITIVVTTWFFLELFILPGTAGANSYGLVPLKFDGRSDQA